MIVPTSFLILAFWFGPAAVLLLISLVAEQKRYAPNGTQPSGNRVLRSLAGGIIAAAAWFALVVLLVLITGAGNAGLWIVFTPWAFAAGQAVGLFWRSDGGDATRPPSPPA